MIIFYDFLCPYAWRGLELMDRLGMQPELKSFSLTQGNHKENTDRSAPTWWLSDQPPREGTDAQQGALRAFLAEHAAHRQGAEARRSFALQLFRLRHAEGQPLTSEATVHAAAERAGLDARRFQADLTDDTELRASLREELAEAARVRVFGTPTFVLDSGDAAYFRFRRIPESESDARALWETYVNVLRSEAGIETIKRPR